MVRFCTGRLDDAERRIEILLADKEGRLHVEPFPEELEDTMGDSRATVRPEKERRMVDICATYRSRKRSLMTR